MQTSNLNSSQTVFELRTTPACQKIQKTWGLASTGVEKFSGKNIKIAVLDTGLNRDHPDLYKRNIHSRSFVVNESIKDGNGHGTHCTGIIFASRMPSQGQRYGIAPDAEMYIAKVLPNHGVANVRYVIQGIRWALENKCQIISVSLGNKVRYGENHSMVFEQLGQQALSQGALIIASAGNDSFRDIDALAPVSHPANCPSIMSVGAVDVKGNIYDRSNRAINKGGGNIDLVAPGVAIYSAWKSPHNYKILSGTSMASSFVAGIAALWLEANPGLNPLKLKELLKSTAAPLNLPREDAGAGLVQAPR